MLKEAAVLAVDYVLTHKGTFSQHTTVSQLDQRAQPFFPNNHSKGRIMQGEMTRITNQMPEVCGEGIHHSHPDQSVTIIKRKGM